MAAISELEVTAEFFSYDGGARIFRHLRCSRPPVIKIKHLVQARDANLPSQFFNFVKLNKLRSQNAVDQAR